LLPDLLAFTFMRNAMEQYYICLRN